MNIVRLAAAGAGKTWQICHEALAAVAEDSASRVLMVTYTNRGVDSILTELKQQNYGVVPFQIVVMSWYQFLLRELIRPYQTYIADINEVIGYDYSLQHEKNYAKAGTKRRYITPSHNIRSEEASNLVLLLNEKSGGRVFNRLEKTYAHIYIDEVQDMAGRDINILEDILHTNIHLVCVGDNKQATFQTHTARANRKLTGRNIYEFFSSVEKEGLAVIEQTLCSRRFNADICNFANAVHPNDNNMTTSMTTVTGHDGVFIIERKDSEKYCSYFCPQELRYNKTTEICGDFALNFGECKGKTYDRCLIHANQPFIDFLKGKTLKSPSKYYVAVTRARYSNAIVVERFFDAPGFEPCAIPLYGEEIPARRYIGRE